MSAKGFDKNSIIGLVLIGAILLIFSIISSPSEEELKAKKEKEIKEKEKVEMTSKESIKDTSNTLPTSQDTSLTAEIAQDSTGVIEQDSIKSLELAIQYGQFANATQGEEKNFIIENEKIKVTISNKGGRIASVELKEFHTYDSLPLMLFNADSSKFDLEIAVISETGSSKSLRTQDLFFDPVGSSFKVEQDNKKSLSMKLYYGSKNKYIEYKYTLQGNSYLVDFDIKTVGMENVLQKGIPFYAYWQMSTPSQEKTIANQQQQSTIFYQYTNGDVDDLGMMSTDREKMEVDVNWIMFKQQYFNSAIIAKNNAFTSESDIKAVSFPEDNKLGYVKNMEANISIPYEGIPNESFNMQFYFGPNKYDDLKDLGLGLENSINYGWPIIKHVNKFIMKPIFNMLNSTGMSIGWIILLLTLIIKTILFPITWKTYLSSAKMRVLKPEIAELTEKYKNDAMKKQQATMALYRQTGVNPLAGCIPMLIQMPILFALFRFFPATFDLRQKSLFWADDLSTYDSIYDFPGDFYIPMYGDHISLFTLLMAISMIFYTRVNSQMTSGMGDGAMASQMKIMTYLMPIMMLFFFNSYAAGLSLYYLIANCITIGQQYVIRKWIVDEDKLRTKIQANKTKKKKKSGFAARLEKRMKEAQEMQNQRKKRK